MSDLATEILAAYERKDWGKLTDLAVDAAERLAVSIDSRATIIGRAAADIDHLEATNNVTGLAAIARDSTDLAQRLLRQAASSVIPSRRSRVVMAPPSSAIAIETARVMDEHERGYVYFIRDGDEVKIGRSRNPWSRLSGIRTSRPGATLVAVERGGKNVEKARHYQFRNTWVAGEWFRMSPAMVAALVAISSKSPGLSDYHETLPVDPTQNGVVSTVVDDARNNGENSTPEVDAGGHDNVVVAGHVPFVPVNNDATVAVAVAVDVGTTSSTKNQNGNGPDMTPQPPAAAHISAIIPDVVQSIESTGVIITEQDVDRSDYDLEHDHAAFAWGRNLANGDRYREILAEVNATQPRPSLLDMALQETAVVEWRSARDRELINRCADAAGFPNFEVWRTARVRTTHVPRGIGE